MYQKTYFYIDSGYRYGAGYPGDEAKAAFRAEAAGIFKRLGWEIRPGNDHGICDAAVNGKQELYLHPMEFSGVILAEEVPAIETALQAAKTFRLREIRRFAQYEDMSDEAYAAYLDAHRDEMVNAILTAYQTKRRNLYITGDQSERIGKPFRVLRLASKNESGDMAFERVNQLTEELIAGRQLITAQTRHGRGVRSAVPADTGRAARQAETHEGR